jgi:hypothetical protein
MDNAPFPDFSTVEMKKVGKMQHGYNVETCMFDGKTFYAVKINDIYASFMMCKEVNIPKLGSVVESIAAKTKKEYAGHKLSIKLKMFLSFHLGLHILFGDMHSPATQKLLVKISDSVDLCLVDIKNGDIKKFSIDEYHNLTSSTNKTDWQVLLKKSNSPTFESFGNQTTPTWAWFDWFDDNKQLDTADNDYFGLPV